MIRFKKYDFLIYNSTHNGTLVTITNWELYQLKKSRPNKLANTDLITNKNDKNVKNDKNDKNLKEKTFYVNIYNNINRYRGGKPFAISQIFFYLTKNLKC